jgi:phenylacetic acid degradation operon negative regulatory protein
VKPTAKRVVLELLSVADAHELSAASLVGAGRLLGISDNNIRVALARLVAAGTIEATARGEYRLAASAQPIARHVTGWRELEKRVRRWDGGWIFVHTGDVRGDRTAARRGERALRLLGFRPLGRALEVRPDNLHGGACWLRERLYALGLDRGALVVRAGELDAATEQRARELWGGARLSASYLQLTERIERWLATIDTLPRARAARDAFFFGGAVLREIIYDPRLPEPLVDVAARRALLDAARRLDDRGRRLWAQLPGELRRVA